VAKETPKMSGVQSKISVLRILPEIVLGAIIGGLSVCRFIDLNWWLILVPFTSAAIGAALAAWRFNRRSSPDESARLRALALRWSIATILGGPALGFVLAALAVPNGAARPFHLTAFSIIGLIAGSIFSASLLTAAIFLKSRPDNGPMKT
jgi:hypothetical protein